MVQALGIFKNINCDQRTNFLEGFLWNITHIGEEEGVAVLPRGQVFAHAEIEGGVGHEIIRCELRFALAAKQNPNALQLWVRVSER